MESELYRDLSTDKTVRCFDPDTGITMEIPHTSYNIDTNYNIENRSGSVFSETQVALINEMIDKRLEELKVQTFKPLNDVEFTHE